jgi:DNA-binding protein HU-beta
MTKAEFVDDVAERADLSRADAKRAVEAFLEAIEDALGSGDEVQFAGFGKFSTADRPAREGVNPRDPGGPKIQIPARRVPKFSAGAALKSSVDR